MTSAQSPGEGTPIPTTEVDGDVTAGQIASNVTDEQWTAMQSLLDTVYDFRTADGHDPSKVFHRKVNKRILPDYYQVITEAIALSTIKAKINQKTYIEFAQIVRDFALIVHNAQVYNRPDAGAYQDALEIKILVESELMKLVDTNLIPADTAKLPFLGEIPPQEDPPPEEKAGAEEEDEDDESASGGDESEEGDGRRKSKVRIKTRVKTEEGTKDDAQAAADAEARRKRGRPLKVDTPLEARIKNILKGMRRLKNEADEPMANSFDRLPDRTIMPGYYDEIKSPMAIDILKKKAKRKKYNSVDEFLQDANLMFENAKMFNEDDSQIYRDAVSLQRETQRLGEAEKKRPDTEFVMEDGRLPLPEGIVRNGELYKVGDWVHIQNKNDLTKPIVSQIYRTWQDANGQKFVNACWYYRPEQTVHRYDKHFYESEVVKTGQYRDHAIEEIVDRCFVMFITRFSKGRPRNFPRDKEIYVCEGRYNEDKFTLNKIKTWASCLPDEVRDKDYEMELYHEPKRMKKQPSPIAYLLKDGQKETDDFPQPEWGADNAPPKIGAVHRRPREGKESPPPERTPSPEPEPTPPPPQPTRQAPPTMQHQQPNGYSRAPNPNFERPTPARQSGISAATPSQPGTSALAPHQRQYQPMITPAMAASQQAPIQRMNSYSSHTPSTHPHQQVTSTGPRLGPSDFAGLSRYPPPPSTLYANNATSSLAAGAAGGYKAPQPIEVWSLNDAANLAIPLDIREQFQRDDAGRVLFFTAPPLETPALGRRLSSGDVEGDEVLGHSVAYLAGKAERDEKLREARKRRAEEVEERRREEVKRAKVEQEEVGLKLKQITVKAVGVWKKEMAEGARIDFERLFGKEEGEKILRQTLAAVAPGISEGVSESVDRMS